LKKYVGISKEIYMYK